MTKRKASFLTGTAQAPYLLPAEDHRLNHAGLWTPSSVPGAAALAVQSGVVWGPGNPGNVAVVAGGVTVSPFHAAIQGTRSGVQGVFEVTSDAAEFLAITAASSTQFRRGRIGVRISEMANGATSDVWDLEVIYGAAAATAGAAVLPAVPADATWFELRQFAVSNTGAITLSGITPRTMPRGAILPVEAGDVTPGAYTGQYRDDPTVGLQRWSGAAWGSPQVRPHFYGFRAAAFSIPGGVWTSVPFDVEEDDTHNGHAAGATEYVIPVSGYWVVQGGIAWTTLANGARSSRLVARAGGTTTPLRGTGTYNDSHDNSWSGNMIPTASRRVFLTAGTAIAVQGWQNGSTSLGVLGVDGDATCFLQATYDS